MKNEVGGACSICGSGERRYRVLRGILREEDHLEDLRVVGRIILNWIFKQ